MKTKVENKEIKIATNKCKAIDEITDKLLDIKIKLQVFIDDENFEYWYNECEVLISDMCNKWTELSKIRFPKDNEEPF